MLGWERTKWRGYFMKIFNASVSGGKVKANGGEVVGCPILGEGGDSQGYLIMAEGDLVYIPKTSPDLSKTLQYLSTALNTIATGIFQANMGGNITTETFAVEIANIKNQIEELRGKLR